MKKRPNRPMDPDVLASVSFGSELDPSALDTPERIIEYFRSQGFIANGCTSIESAIAANPELELCFEDLGDNDAYIMKKEDSGFKIAVNSKHHKNRQRFSMAHEYVHYQLHREQIGMKPVGERILYRNAERNPIEYQANRVAGEILMPHEEFLAFVKETGGNIRAIANVFNVSLEAVRVRAMKLGYVLNGE